jgi:hypothetical protein
MFDPMYVRLLLGKPNIGLRAPGYPLANKTVTIEPVPTIPLPIDDQPWSQIHPIADLDNMFFLHIVRSKADIMT